MLQISKQKDKKSEKLAKTEVYYNFNILVQPYQLSCKYGRKAFYFLLKFSNFLHVHVHVQVLCVVIGKNYPLI